MKDRQNKEKYFNLRYAKLVNNNKGIYLAY